MDQPGLIKFRTHYKNNYFLKMHSFSLLNSGSKSVNQPDPRDFLRNFGSQILHSTLKLLIDDFHNLHLFYYIVWKNIFVLGVLFDHLVPWFKIFTMKKSFLRVLILTFNNYTFCIRVTVRKILLIGEVSWSYLKYLLHTTDLKLTLWV